MKLTLLNRLKLCWEVLTIKDAHPGKTDERSLSTFQHGYQAGLLDNQFENQNRNAAIVEAEAAFQLSEKYGYWNEHPIYEHNDWLYDVRDLNSLRGYWAWVANQIDQEENE